MRGGLGAQGLPDGEPLAPGIRRAIVLLSSTLILAVLATSVAAYVLVGSPSDGRGQLEATVDAVATESKAVTDRFLEVAQTSAGIVARVTPGDQGGEARSPSVRQLLETVVAENREVDGAFVGWPDGSFLYVTRSLAEAPDGYRVKQIVTSPRRVATEWQIASDFSELAETNLSDDEFDPRSRPWYRSALTQDIGWTATYEFASSGEPGITHFRTVVEETGIAAVVGIDMQLVRVETFLSERAPGDDGIAAMVSPDGRVISGQRPPTSEMLELLGDQVTRIDESTDGEGPLRVTTVRPLDSDWSLLVSATADDFGGRVADQARRVRGVLPLLGLVLAGLIAWAATAAANRVARLQRRANEDPQTGLANRSYYRRRLWRRLFTPVGPPDFVVAIAEVSRAALDTGPKGETPQLTGCVEAVQALTDAHRDGLVGRSGDRELGFFLGSAGRSVHRELRSLVQHTSGIDQVGYVEASREAIEGTTIDDVLRNAERALREARMTNQPVVRYDAILDEQFGQDRARRDVLARAIKNNEFCVHFQPEVDLGTREIIGAEALLRWQPGSGQCVPASAFIGDLERFDLLRQLGDLIVSETAALAASIDRDDFGYRVNFAAEQLGDDTFEVLRDAHRKTRGTWCIEITERTMIQLTEPVLANLASLAAEGIEVALDDFGTGYSSLAELERLPLTVLKLDRSFVSSSTNERSREMIALIAQIAGTFDLDLVAEGIEVEEQAATLFELGYGRAQGWLFGHAMPRSSFLWSLEREASRAMPGSDPSPKAR